MGFRLLLAEALRSLTDLWFSLNRWQPILNRWARRQFNGYQLLLGRARRSRRSSGFHHGQGDRLRCSF